MPNSKHWRSSPENQARARQLRRDATPAERKLWQAIGGKRLNGAYFRRQHAMDAYIVDFFCAKAKLIVEIDGDTHAGQQAYDAQRTAWLINHHGCRVVRFTNREVMENLDGIVFRLAELLADSEQPRAGRASGHMRDLTNDSALGVRMRSRFPWSSRAPSPDRFGGPSTDNAGASPSAFPGDCNTVKQANPNPRAAWRLTPALPHQKAKWAPASKPELRTREPAPTAPSSPATW